MDSQSVLNTVSCVLRLGSESGVTIEAVAEDALELVGTPLQVVLWWGAGQGERRGSCTPTPPRCHATPLLSPASELEKVWEHTTQRYLHLNCRYGFMIYKHFKGFWEEALKICFFWPLWSAKQQKSCQAIKDERFHSSKVTTVQRTLLPASRWRWLRMRVWLWGCHNLDQLLL